MGTINEDYCKAERERLLGLLDHAGVPPIKQMAVAGLVDNLAWQRIKLNEARVQMRDACITCHYDNGGGQSGERENPVFKAYINLWRAYIAGMEKYLAYLPKDLQSEAVKDDGNVLERVLQMRRAPT